MIVNPEIRVVGRTIGKPIVRKVVPRKPNVPVYPPTAPHTPGTDVRPMKLVSFLPEEGVIKNGFYVVPPIWVQGEGLCSTTGEYLNSDRPNPRDVNVECHSRFLAGEDFWDDIAGVWRPYVTRGVDYYWLADPAHKPTGTTLDYRIGKEVMEFDVLLFQSEDFLESQFNGGLDDASEMTIIMVASFDNPSDYDILINGPRKIHVTESFELSDGTKRNVAKTLVHPTQISPCIVVYSVNPPNSTIWVISPDRKIVTTTLSNSSDVADMVFTLGPAAMRLMEFTILDYAVRTSGTEDRMNIFQVASLYSSMYGAI